MPFWRAADGTLRELEGSFARITIRVKLETQLWSNATVFKKSASLLGEFYLEIDPGTAEGPDPMTGKMIKNHLLKDSFTDRYDVTNLVWYEAHESAESAITREKRLKEWRRGWKVELIHETNPTWRDLWDDISDQLGP